MLAIPMSYLRVWTRRENDFKTTGGRRVERKVDKSPLLKRVFLYKTINKYLL